MFTHQGTKTIETARLILRRARQQDGPAMFRNWASDPEVTKYLTWPTHESPEISQWVLDSWVDQYSDDQFYQWIIEPKEFGEAIGTISVVRQNDVVGSMEIGYCIGRSWWHKGIVTEALMAVVHFLFSNVGCERIEARHDPRNPNSGRVMTKCGLQYEGTLRNSDKNNQGICDAAVYGLLRSDWVDNPAAGVYNTQEK